MWTRFKRDESGAAAIEYGLICALIFLVIVTSVAAVANRTTGMFNTIATAVGNATR